MEWVIASVFTGSRSSQKFVESVEEDGLIVVGVESNQRLWH